MKNVFIFIRWRLSVWRSQCIRSHKQRLRCVYFRSGSSSISRPPCQPLHRTSVRTTWRWIQLCTTTRIQYWVCCSFSVHTHATIFSASSGHSKDAMWTTKVQVCAYLTAVSDGGVCYDAYNNGSVISSSRSAKSFTASPAGQQAIAGRKIKTAVRRRK